MALTHVPYSTTNCEAGAMLDHDPTAATIAAKVLVIEDDRRMRKYLRAALADQGFRVIEA